MKFIKVLASIVGFVGIGMQAPSAQAQVAIGDFIYADDNRNGEFDSNESGLQGVLVTVFTDDDNNATPDAGIDTTRTMASGLGGGYYFEDLPAGRYCVQITPPENYTLTAGAGSMPSPTCFSTNDGDIITNIDFGFGPPVDEAPFSCDGSIYQIAVFKGSSGDDAAFPTLYELEPFNGVYNYTAVSQSTLEGTINGLGFNIVDGHMYAVSNNLVGNTTGRQEFVRIGNDGQFGPGDVVVSSIRVELYPEACPADLTTLENRLAETTTDVNGFYTFDEIPNGDYCVIAETPAIYEAHQGAAGNTVTVADGAIDTADFGFSPLVNIGDFAYIDSNQNGSADLGEPAIVGADVTLYAGLCSASGVVLDTTQTDANGQYLFKDIPSGDYCVEVTNTGAGAAIEGAGGQSVTVTVADVMTADFGFTPAGAIGDQTYIDNNRDQNFDATVDQVLAGVGVNYYAGECPADLTTLGASLGSAVTDANGQYLFTAVTDGLYCVVATNPGVSTALEGAFGQTVEVAGLAVRTADFGFAASGSIGDLTYVDQDLDGIFGGSDTVLPYVTVDLYAGACPADLSTLQDRLQTTTSDANGAYVFTEVAGGDYCVIAENPGAFDPREGELGWSVSVAGNEITTADFGYAPWVSIGDFVYIDNDQSSSAELGEPGVSGVEVTLFSGLCPATGPVLETTLTDVNGFYSFDDLAPGDYCVEVSFQGAAAALEGAGGQSVVLGNVDYDRADFGFIPAGGIGDQTYIDSDQNGVYGLDDKIVSNVTVELYAGDCPVDLSTLSGLIDSQQTDANGQYLFTAVPDGNYCVVAINPGYSTALEGVAGQEVTVAGEIELNADFGFAPTGSVGDLTYADYDLDGLYGAGDEIIPFVTVGIYPGLCPSDLTALPARLRTTNSDVNGLYLFPEMADGEYCVVAENPGSYLPMEGATGQSVTVIGDAILTADFGYAPLVSIGDYVYTDNDQSVSADAGDVPIPGATVTLETGLCSDAARTVVATTQTDFNGLYSFDDLTPGDYCVTVSNAGTGAELQGAGGQSVTLLTADRLDIDFGFAPAGSVGDMVYTDNDRNANYDPSDDALSGATVELYAGDCPADLAALNAADLFATTTTDAAGTYLFTQVPDGDYCVVATSPNSGEALQGKYGQEVEVQGGPELSADFGFEAVGSIGDLVYYDTNTDGTFDTGEPANSNISVLLYSGTCPSNLLLLGVPYDITISDVNGFYQFTELPAGDYCVIANDGGIDTQLQGANGHSVTVNQNDTTTADFGYIPRASIGDTVYADDNGSVLQDGTEPGLFGVPVQLFSGLCDASDLLPLQTFITTLDGLYGFVDLPAGEYCVRAIAGDVGTLTQGSAGHSVTLNGVDQLDADFGIQRAGDLRLFKSVSDLTPTPIAVGDPVTFDLRVFNESSIVTMTDIELTDFVPEGFTFVSATDGGVHDGSALGGDVVWNIASLAPRATQTVSVTLTVNETGSLTNLAEITGALQPDVDSVPGNRASLPDEDDTAAVNLLTQSVSDLVLSKTALNPTPLLGEQVTFEVTVTNNGPSDTSNVTDSDILPNGLAFVSASEPLSTTAIPQEYVWTVGDLAVGETQSLTLVADTVASHIEKLDYINIAEVATSDSQDPTSTPGNMIDPVEDDEASAVVYPSAVALGKDLVSFAPASSGAEGNFDATFELLVHNTGATELVNVELIDDLIGQMGDGLVDVLSVTISEPAMFVVSSGNVMDDDALLNSAFIGTNPATEVIRSDANVSLAPSDRFIVTFVAEVAPDKVLDSDADGLAGPFRNQATVTATIDPVGLPSGYVLPTVQDTSDNDHDLDGSKGGSETDSTGIPSVSLAKNLLSSQQPAVIDGVEVADTLAMTVEHRITNTGGVPLNNIEFREDLLNSAAQVVSIIDEGQVVFTGTLPVNWTADNLDSGYASVPDFRPFLGGTSILEPGETLVFQTTIVADLDPSLGGSFQNASSVRAYADVDGNGSYETTVSDTSDNDGDIGADENGDGDSSNDETPLPSVLADKQLLEDVIVLDASAGSYRSNWGFWLTNTGQMDLVDVAVLDDFANQNDAIVSVDAVTITLIDDTAAGSKWSVSQSNFLDDDWIVTPVSLEPVEFGDGSGNTLEPGATLYFEAQVDFTLGDIDGPTTLSNTALLGGYGDDDGDGIADDQNNDGEQDFWVFDSTASYGAVDGNGNDDDTTVEIGRASVSAQKSLVSVEIDNTNGHSLFTFELRVINTGDYALTDLSIIEDMAGQFGDDGTYYVYQGLTAAPEVQFLTADVDGYNQINLNPNFDGGLDGSGVRTANTDILGADSQLAKDGEVVIRFEAIADTGLPSLAAPFTNAFNVEGYVDQNADGLADDNDGDGNRDAVVTDESDNGFDQEGQDEATDADTIPDNDPTPLPAISASKSLRDVEYPYVSGTLSDDSANEIRMVFDFNIENTGSTRLEDVRIAEGFVDQPALKELTSASVISLTASNPDLWKAMTLDPQFATLGLPTVFQTLDGNTSGVATLDPGDFVDVQIELIATLDPQLGASFTNGATFYANVDLDGDGRSDGAYDGVIGAKTDGDGDPYNDDDGNGDPTDDPTPLPLIGVTKVLRDDAISQTGNRSFEAVFDVEIHNTGSVELTDIEFLDDFMAQNNGDEVIIESIDSVTVEDLTYTPSDEMLYFFTADTLETTFMSPSPAEFTAFTGGLNTLAPGDSVSFSIRTGFTMVQGYEQLSGGVDLVNAATVRGTSVDNPMHVVEDTGGETLSGNSRDSTEIGLPVLRVEKDLVSVSPSTDSNTTELTFQLQLANLGTVPLTGLTLTDDLVSSLGGVIPDGGFAGLISEPQWIDAYYREAGDTYTYVQVDPSFDGTSANSNLLLPESKLEAGSSITIEFTVELAHDHPNLPADLYNSALATGETDQDRDGKADTDGQTVSDVSDNNFDNDATDQSGDSDPGNDPTPLPALQTLKSLTQPFVPVGSGADATSYSGQFQFTLTNKGLLNLGSLTFVDHFLDNAGVSSVDTVTVSQISSNVADSDFIGATLDPTFITQPASVYFDNGTGSMPVLVPGERITFTASIVFTYDEALQDGSLLNTATTMARVDLDEDGDPSNDSAMIVDETDGDGDPNSDSDGNGNPGDDPVGVLGTGLGLAKTFVVDADSGLGGVPYSADPSYFVYTVRLYAQNTGEIPLTDVILVDSDPANWGMDVIPVDQPQLVQPTSQGSTIVLRTDYDPKSGQAELTAAGSRLQPGETFAIEFSIAIDLQDPSIEYPLDEAYTNQAVIFGSLDGADASGFGDGTADLFDTNGDGVVDGPVTLSDLSDSGINPIGTNAGASGDTGGSNDPTPLLNALPPQFQVMKRADKASLAAGDNAQWTVTVENTGATSGLDVQIVDVLPAGLVYVRGTGQINGEANLPTVTAAGTYPRGDNAVVTGVNGKSVTATGEVLTWTVENLEPGETLNITFFTQAAVGVTPGQTLTNNAYVYDPKWPDDRAIVSNVAEGDIQIVADAAFGCSTVIGQVFNDLDGNGYQDAGEPGVATQRIVALVDGTAKTIRTDKYGRYHVPCASLPSQHLGSNIILKLDDRHAPTGFRMTTENPRVVRLTAGKMTKVNFGVQIARVVDLTLNGCAFQGSSTELTEASKLGMQSLIDTLAAGRSSLRLTYRQVDEGNNLVKRRTRSLAKLVKELWQGKNGDYKLEIETALIRVVGEGAQNCDAAAYAAPQPAAQQQQKIEVIETIKVEPAASVRRQQVQQIQQVQQVQQQVQQVQATQQQYVQQYAQQQYVLQGYVTQEQLQQGHQSGLIQLNENGQAYTSNVNGLNALGAGQAYGGVATGYINGGALSPAYGVVSGVTSAGASAAVSTTSGRASSGAGSVSGSGYVDPLTEETRRLLESTYSTGMQGGSLDGTDPLSGW